MGFFKGNMYTGALWAYPENTVSEADDSVITSLFSIGGEETFRLMIEVAKENFERKYPKN